MASALAAGLLKAGVAQPSDLAVYDKLPEASARFAERFGARPLASSRELCELSRVVFLCVKPSDVAAALRGDAGDALEGKLLISVAAGVSIASLQRLVNPQCYICRTMPNTAAEVQKAITSVAFAPNVPAPLREQALRAFASIGRTLELDETLFDAAVALGGSGPAYACLLIEAMSNAGAELGLPRAAALELATHAVLGAAALAAETGRPPADIRAKITSPGGTTLAALTVFEEAGTREIIRRAVRAAAARSAELGKLLDS